MYGDNPYDGSNNRRSGTICDGDEKVQFIETRSVYNAATYPINRTVSVTRQVT